MPDQAGVVDVDDESSAVATSRLLWAASTPWPRASAIAELVDRDADVQVAARIAHDHQTGPLVWSALGAAGRRELLGSEHDLLRNDYHLHRGRATLLVPTAVATAIEPLARAGLEPVIVKGPALAARYPEPGLRPMDDVDLIVPPHQFEVAVEAMMRSGWSVARGPDRDHPYDAVLVHPSIPHLPVEVHRGLSPWREQSNRLTARDVWDARVPIDCLGTPAYGLPAEDELVFLCAHAGKPFHQFARLIWSVDLMVSLRFAGASLDWDRVARRARGCACSTVVAVGLLHARRLGATVPDELVTLPTSRFRRAALAPVLDEGWPLHSYEAGGVRHRMRYALSDLWSRRALLLLGEVSADGVAELPRQSFAALSRAFRRWKGWRRSGSFGEPFEPDTTSTRAPET